MYPVIPIIMAFAFFALFCGLTLSVKKTNQGNKPGAQSDGEPGKARPGAEARGPAIPRSGGSIHNGSHEGMPRTGGLPRSGPNSGRTAEAPRRANAAADEKRNTGACTLKQREDEVPSGAANGAQAMADTIAGYPPAVQGVIWSEVLNPPVSMR